MPTGVAAKAANWSFAATRATSRGSVSTKGPSGFAAGDDYLEDKVDITLPGVTFRSVTIAGVGDVHMEDVDQTELDLTIAGAGEIKADGHSDAVKLTIAGAGDAHLGKLTTKRLGITITGVGSAEASPQDDADVTIMGAGKVDLLTRPARHDFDVFGAGEVNMPDRT